MVKMKTDILRSFTGFEEKTEQPFLEQKCRLSQFTRLKNSEKSKTYAVYFVFFAW